MDEFIRGIGQLQALQEMGLLPAGSLEQLGLPADQGNVGLTAGMPQVPYLPAPEEQQDTQHVLPFIRKFGPLAGGLIGAPVEMAMHTGHALPYRALRGFLAGAGIGSIPNVVASGVEAVRNPQPPTK
jgi:hypothetical protein